MEVIPIQGIFFLEIPMARSSMADNLIPLRNIIVKSSNTIRGTDIPISLGEISTAHLILMGKFMTHIMGVQGTLETSTVRLVATVTREADIFILIFN